MKNYNEVLLTHFFHSAFVGELPVQVKPVKVCVGQGSGTDSLQLQLQINAESQIVAARFKAHGNPYTIASASLLCELIQGQTVNVAKQLTHKTLLQTLEIPITHRHSALLAEQALQAAMLQYERGRLCTI